MNRHSIHAFTFPKTLPIILPNPSSFFLPHLFSSPLPTNSFFQNFVLKNGDQPEYIHPYLIKSSISSLPLSYTSLFLTLLSHIKSLKLILPFRSSITRIWIKPVISLFNDLNTTLDIQPNLRFFLVRGSLFLTFQVLQSVALSISTIHTILNCVLNSSKTKYKINLNNG